ncbi:hypothetical protein Tco_0161628 [Tanacetum coccineum]
MDWGRLGCVWSCGFVGYGVLQVWDRWLGSLKRVGCCASDVLGDDRRYSQSESYTSTPSSWKSALVVTEKAPGPKSILSLMLVDESRKMIVDESLDMIMDESLDMIVDESFDMIVDVSLDMIVDESLMVEDKSLEKHVDETLKLDE